MVKLGDQSMRASLQVAPLTIHKTSRSGSLPENGYSTSTTTIEQAMTAPADSNQHSHSHTLSSQQMTPPATPNGSQEDLSAAPAANPPVFHNFLRAFYHFHPSYAMSDSTVTLPLNEGDVILVHSIHTNGWADGTLLVSGARGWLPTNYCEAYDPDEMRNLLKALLNFWDLLRSPSVNDGEIFGNQEFMKGIIAGVRYLLERTHSLTRESPLIQRHEGLRRSRKSLLSELSSLVKTAKRLQDHQRTEQPSEEVNDMVDEMILKAFKIVTKSTRFLDIYYEDRRSRAPSVTVMATVLEEPSCIPPTPPADSTSFEQQQLQPARLQDASDAGFVAGAGADGRFVTPSPQANTDANAHANLSPVRRQTSEAEAAQNPVHNRRTSSLCSPGSSPVTDYQRRLSQNNPTVVHRLSSTLSHRVSLAGHSPLSSPQNLVSQRLSDRHDTFLSYLGSFIGRLHLQSQSRPQLALAIQHSATSGGELLVVVDVVCAHNHLSRDILEEYRAAMYHRLRDLVRAARDILCHQGPDTEDVIVPHDNSRLLYAATGCVRATGECVAKTKWFIERIGDFEYDFDDASSGLDLDLSFLQIVSSDDSERENNINATTAALEAGAYAESTISSVPSEDVLTSNRSSPTPTPTVRSTNNLSLSLSIDKPLPQVPQEERLSREPDPTQLQPSPPPSRPQSLIIEDGASSIASSVSSSLRPVLPPLPKLSTSLLSQGEYSPTEDSAGNDSEYHSSFRSTESTAASSTGSNSTYLSRGSEASLVSQTSTRATTPDHPLVGQQSFSDLSSSVALADEVDDVESKLLERTFAHELMFNKEGQVTGGSLPALVERLTTHESTPDAMFVSTFYLTFRLFCTPLRLAESLIERFDYVGESPHMAGPVRLRVYNVFKGWLESHWRDETDREALALIEPFADYKLGAILPSAGRRILELVERVSAADGTLVPRLVSSMGKTNTAISLYVPADTPLPAPILTKSQSHALANWKAGGSCPTILDFDPLEVARQLTVRQMSTFCSIMPEELLGSQWMKKGGVDAPNVKAMSSLSTDLSNLVADTILHYGEVKRRAAVIKQWIKIAHRCHELNNYDALMAIICSLNSSTITRLRRTWDIVSPRRRELLKQLQAIVEPSQNHKALRARLHDHVPPCLPFLGMFLTDLTFVDIGNPPTKQLPGTDGTDQFGITVVNFDKHTRTAKIIGELQRFQIPYRLTEVPELQEWMQAQISRVRELETPGNNVQVSYYRKSLLLEPREPQTLRTPIDGVPSAATPSAAAAAARDPQQQQKTDLFGWMRTGSSATHTTA